MNKGIDFGKTDLFTSLMIVGVYITGNTQTGKKKSWKLN